MTIGAGRACVVAVFAAVRVLTLTAADRTPVIVELFTSEGCSSCPPADSVLRDLAVAQPVAGAEIIALGEHVDYWDGLGWRDRFSSPALTRRQQAYGGALRVESIYTPQLVVDGQAELVGSDAGAARRAIDRASRLPHGRLALEVTADVPESAHATLTIANVPSPTRDDRDEVILAVVEDRLSSDVRGGENRGRTLVHAAVVRSLETVGALDARATGGSIAVPRIPIARDWVRAHLTIVAFVQEVRRRRIVASAAQALPVAR